MERISYTFLVMYVYQCIIKEAVSTYVLLRGTRSEVESECSRSHGGSITIFRSTPPAELIGVLRNDSSVSVWNGYKYTSRYVENTGCFEKIGPHLDKRITVPDLTIAYCEHFCNRYKIAYFAIQESQCLCVDPDEIVSNFVSLPGAQHCNYTCNMKQDEYCGSKRNSPFYNIYSVLNFSDEHYTSEDGLCLSYKLRKDEIEASVCDVDFGNRLACRSIDNTIEWIRSPARTWEDALRRCLDLNKSYLASYLEVRDENSGRIWLNERKYRTVVEDINAGDEGLEECQTFSVENDELVTHEGSCAHLEPLQFVCKKGDDFEIESSTNTFSQTIMSATQDSSTGSNSQKHSTSTLTYQQNVSSDIKHSSLEANDSGNGLMIGGVVGAVLLIAITGGILVVFVLRRRHAGPCNKKSEYQSQEVRYSTSNGVTNSAYGSGRVYEILQGNQDRNAQGDYTKIKDEDLRISGNIHSKAKMCDDPRSLSPPNAPLYMVLEKETTSEPASFSPFTNYESARPIPDQKLEKTNVSENDERNWKGDDMEYDHLRQEAYEHTVTDENVYNHADTDNDYSHISQVTKINDNHKDDGDDDDDYTHTGDFEAHSGTSVQNDMDGTYAHANDNYDNGGDMAESRPYELAQNIHRHETDTDESKPNTCAQLNTEDGDYSFAKPID